MGNSSAGLLEAPYFATPAINVGTRQSQRSAGKNLIRVPHDSGAIAKALKKAGQPAFINGLKPAAQRHLYGDGNTGTRIAKILAKTKVDHRLLVKKIVY